MQCTPAPTSRLENFAEDLHSDEALQAIDDSELSFQSRERRQRNSFFTFPMSFMENFKTEVFWGAARHPTKLGIRSKRSPLDETQFRSAMVSAILQRQLLMAEDHRLHHFDRGIPVPTHHVSAIALPRQLPPVVLTQGPISIFRGYEAPIKGGSLEEIFGVSSKFYQPPATKTTHKLAPSNLNSFEVYESGPKYVPVPLDVYPVNKPLRSYQPPSYRGHPFSMEMVFGLPMHDHYMAKYSHLLPERLHPHQIPIPHYEDAPYRVYKKHGYQIPSRGGSLETIFGLAS